MRKDELAVSGEESACIPIKPLSGESVKDFYYFTSFLTLPPKKRKISGEGFSHYKKEYPLDKITYTKWLRTAEQFKWQERKTEFDLWVLEQGMKQTLNVGITYANELLEYRDYFSKSIGEGNKTRETVSKLLHQVGEEVENQEEMTTKEKAFIAKTLATTQQMLSSSLRQDFDLWTTLIGVETLFEEKKIEQV
jgi:hypothetical protein